MRIETMDTDRDDRHVAEDELASFVADVEASELRLTPAAHDLWCVNEDHELGLRPGELREMTRDAGL